REAQRLSSCIDITQGPPDEDSYTLIRALLEGGSDPSASARARREAYLRREVGYTLMRSMLGDTRADALRIPSRATRHLVPALRRGLSTVEHLSSWIPGQRARSVAAGQRYWERVTTTLPPR